MPATYTVPDVDAVVPLSPLGTIALRHRVELHRSGVAAFDRHLTGLRVEAHALPGAGDAAYRLTHFLEDAGHLALITVHHPWSAEQAHGTATAYPQAVRRFPLEELADLAATVYGTRLTVAVRHWHNPAGVAPCAVTVVPDANARPGIAGRIRHAAETDGIPIEYARGDAITIHLA